MASHHDPRLLYSIKNIRAFHIQNGKESALTPSGPQTLSLLMVPTTTTFPEQPNTAVPSEPPEEEDFYLHLHLPPELDMALPATAQIYHQPPNSYLIPRWDMGPDAGAFIRIEFPGIGSGPQKVTQEDVDTFETILAQCTAFLERETAPSDCALYNPADYAPGEGYISSYDKTPAESHGKIVLVDEEDGSVVGELTDGYEIVEKPDVKPGSKTPVEVELPREGEGNQISVENASPEYLRMARHPAYKNSTIVQTSATASRLIVTGSAYLANALTNGADSFVKKTNPNPTPLRFSETTQTRIRKINTFSQDAASLSARTVGSVSRYAQSLGATLGRHKENDKRRAATTAAAAGGGKTAGPSSGADYKPGILNKSMIAFSTLADGIEHGARAMLASSSSAASTMVSHRYGPDAGAIAAHLTGGFKNVGLVYIDATGVSRKAVLKSVAKGMVVGRMRNGDQVVVGGGDGGDVDNPPPPPPSSSSSPSRSPSSSSAYGTVQGRATPPPGYGSPAPTTLGGTRVPGRKRYL
ncbi:hypothetical protein ASPZODRAFT_26250 [Penicilliopsis zonata CBS 506.65]|uniref:Senescence domain-containing protein n=1 Tax=Penicilliopsis zonata CBS 506.65 TaxID=1073090 RepID=A0A1L9SEM4_9EURO|nr:hypothetical protein ASPZODRAFT_26250 [Penicilliopsis zonata CBS 506.65]OJJ45602.1 hypothetical protein ASPZODRAFT_26250 [Penicilliopsis zonata CBS 506.65]